MKFGTEYQDALRKEEYPPQWLESAISYKKLKKCIKKVREELLSLGLDHETLDALWQHVSSATASDASSDNADRMMHYSFSPEDGKKFVPKLTIALDPKDGSPMDAWLSPDTKKILRQIGTHRSHRPSRTPSYHSDATDPRKQSMQSDRDSENTTTRISSPKTSEESFADMHDMNDTSSNTTPVHTDQDDDSENIETIEIPLTSDSEFFQILKKELEALEYLQSKEQKEITVEIDTLGKELQALKSSTSKRARAELDIWREIFRLYIESEIFMSNHEYDAGIRDADKATEFFKQFTKQLTSVNTNPKTPKSQEAHIPLEHFLHINTSLLRLLRFQELNKRALGKILKKFDKQTSLHAISTTTQEQMLKSLTLHPNKPGLNPHDLARSTAYTISTSLLSLIPQLDDYLCPICCMITYKPIRLRCRHVFCIRCMIRLQRDKKDECPLCRVKGVLDLNEDDMDRDLKKFLKREFRKEVDEKRKDNELQAGRDLFGEDYQGTHRCVVM